MVTARYLTEKFLKPSIERRQAEARKRQEEVREKGRAEGHAEGRVEGLAEGHAEGHAEGRAEERRKWAGWNSRRLKAEADGAPFDEPPPDF